MAGSEVFREQANPTHNQKTKRDLHPPNIGAGSRPHSTEHRMFRIENDLLDMKDMKTTLLDKRI